MEQTLSPTPSSPLASDHEEHLFQALESILEQYTQWQKTRLLINLKTRLESPYNEATARQLEQTLSHYGLVAWALERVAAIMRVEVADTVDRFHTWLID